MMPDVFAAEVPAVVLIFNQLPPHMIRMRTPTKEQLQDSRLVDSCQAMIDLFFWYGNMCNCEANTKAVQALREIWNIQD